MKTNKISILIISILAISFIIFIFWWLRLYLLLDYISFKKPIETINLAIRENGNLITGEQLNKAKSFFMQNNDSFLPSLNSRQWIISEYKESGDKKMVTIVALLTYNNLPIFNEEKIWYFDNNTKKLINHFSSGSNDSSIFGGVSPYLESLKNNISSIEPKITYHQALEKALQSKALSNKTTNRSGYTAQLGIIDNFTASNKRFRMDNENEFSGQLVWKILSNDKMLVAPVHGLPIPEPLEYRNQFAIINATTGEFICDTTTDTAHPYLVFNSPSRLCEDTQI